MQTETRFYIDDLGELKFALNSLGSFTFKYPYSIEAKKCVEYLNKLIECQLLDLQIDHLTRDKQSNY